MGRKRRKDSRGGRAEGRVRGRVQQRARGDAKRGGGDSGRKRNNLDLGDLGAIGDYADHLTGRSGGTPDLSGAASGLAGAASGFAGGSFASKLMSGDTPMSDEDFRKEVAEHFALIEERLQQLEDQVSGSGEQGTIVEEDLPEGETSPGSTL